MRFTVHDQGEDAVASRFSIFDGSEIVALIDGDRRAIEWIVAAMNDRDRGETLTKFVDAMKTFHMGDMSGHYEN